MDEHPEIIPARWAEDFEPVVAFNMRDWLQKAVCAQGATVTGAGLGPDGADLDITVEGCRFNVTIKAR